MRAEACAACLRRSWLVQWMSGYVERLRHRSALHEVLALDERSLLAAAGPRRGEDLRRLWRTFDGAAVLSELTAAGIHACCRHSPSYPPRLRELASAPSVLYRAGGRSAGATTRVPVVAVVGTRRATAYGLSVARDLAAGLATAGVRVISGMALGIDGAAHEGALSVRGPGAGGTVAVLAGPPARPYPASRRVQHRAIMDSEGVLSECPPGFTARRWSFLARNRIIAALADAVVVVEAAEHSGSLATARTAGELSRPVAAIPGQVVAPQAAGPHALVRAGRATLVTEASHVLDLIGLEAPRADASPSPPSGLAAPLAETLRRIAEGVDTAAALAATGRAVEDVMGTLGELELLGLVRRAAGGRYVASGPGARALGGATPPGAKAVGDG